LQTALSSDRPLCVFPVVVSELHRRRPFIDPEALANVVIAASGPAPDGLWSRSNLPVVVTLLCYLSLEERRRHGIIQFSSELLSVRDAAGHI
jgi:hypothetical protein